MDKSERMATMNGSHRHATANGNAKKGGVKGIKLTVVGDGGVGKTSLLISYATNTFPREHTPTVFENYAVTVAAGGEPCTLSLFDTAGKDDQLKRLSYPGTNVFLICFSVIDPPSFDSVTSYWEAEIREHHPSAEIIIVGTKQDLRDDPDVLRRLKAKQQKLISYEQGVKAAKNLSACCYVECSALTQYGLKRVFDEAIMAGLHLYDRKRDKRKKEKCVIL